MSNHSEVNDDSTSAVKSLIPHSNEKVTEQHFHMVMLLMFECVNKILDYSSVSFNKIKAIIQ